MKLAVKTFLSKNIQNILREKSLKGMISITFMIDYTYSPLISHKQF